MAKRRATTELTRDNWDAEEPEPEEVGCFQKATDDVLKERVIRQAKRRINNTNTSDTNTPESEPKPIFSGFTGFSGVNESKTKKFSFSTNMKNNDNKNLNEPKHSFSFSNNMKNNDNKNLNEPKHSFTFLSKSDIKSDVPKSNSNTSFSFLSNTSTSKTDETATGRSDIKTASTTFEKKLLPFSSTIPISGNNEILNELSKKLPRAAESEKAVTTDDKKEKTPDDVFKSKLYSLNLLCAEWIIKHLNENPCYILTPIFDDYKKHLNQLREQRKLANTSSNKVLKLDDRAETEKLKENSVSLNPASAFKAPDFKESLSKMTSGKSVYSPLGKSMFTPLTQTTDEKETGFKFLNSSEEKPERNFKFFSASDKKGDAESEKPFASIPINGDSSSVFKFGSNFKSDKKEETEAKSDTKAPSFFSFNANSAPSTNTFSSPKPVTANDDTSAKDDEEDTPPVKEDVTITEDGAIYEKKCKVFIKKDSNFVDHGIGFLFLKLIGEEKKCQVIVRANNTLANIIINVLLTNNVPTQLMKKNNVMIICCPTPDAKPTSVLLKVKTTEDAEELFNKLNEYKK